MNAASQTLPESPAEIAPIVRPQPVQIGTVTVDPPIFQAPMAGFTNYAYRQIVREYGGAGLQATEMVAAKGFLHIDSEEHPCHPRLWGVADEPRPLAVQLWDNDPSILADVGQKLAQDFKVSVVDINFGCPVKQITSAESGSYLLRDPDRIGRIVEQMVKACAPTPVTAKIRLGCTRDKITAIDVAQAIEGAGAAAMTCHGRVASDFFSGNADWDKISAIKPHLKRIPLIGNGDIDTPEKVVEAFRRYPVDGVMIARAALGKPWLFKQAAQAISGQPVTPDPTLAEQRVLLLYHWDLLLRRFPVDRACMLMRKYACCYAQGKPRVRAFRQHVTRIETAQDFLDCVENYFPRDEWQPSRPPKTNSAAGADDSCGESAARSADVSPNASSDPWEGSCGCE